MLQVQNKVTVLHDLPPRVKLPSIGSATIEFRSVSSRPLQEIRSERIAAVPLAPRVKRHSQDGSSAIRGGCNRAERRGASN